MTRNNPNPQDEWLADFADKLMNGEVNTVPTDSPDPETRSLASTLLRLKRAFPEKELDSAATKQMQAQVIKRWHESEQKRPRWLDVFRMEWLTSSHRQQLGMVLAMIIVVGILIVAAPYLFSTNGGLSATAGTGITGLFIWIALGVLTIVIVWLMRHKP